MHSIPRHIWSKKEEVIMLSDDKTKKIYMFLSQATTDYTATRLRRDNDTRSLSSVTMLLERDEVRIT